MRRRSLLFAVAAFVLTTFLPAEPASACLRDVPYSPDELFAADVIVRATAVKYVVAPDANFRTTGKPESTVEFKVEEVLKGENVPDVVLLRGYLSDWDDFNDEQVPYQFVRRNGRHGSCFANTYKEGAQFLLFLKKEADGFTPNISPLGPTNEQLRGEEEDAWLRWIRESLDTHGRAGVSRGRSSAP